jgi:putative zinc finger/helix-turn-helix YgiT family protein
VEFTYFLFLSKLALQIQRYLTIIGHGMKKITSICRGCQIGVLREVKNSIDFFPNKKPVSVDLLASKCSHCGVTRVLSSQHNENLRRLALRKSQYKGQLMGEDYISLRMRYGLSQKQAAKIFGKSVIEFSRYENEECYPEKSTRLLIEIAMEMPTGLKKLADIAGIKIPLWEERFEDALKIES